MVGASDLVGVVDRASGRGGARVRDFFFRQAVKVVVIVVHVPLDEFVELFPFAVPRSAERRFLRIARALNQMYHTRVKVTNIVTTTAMAFGRCTFPLIKTPTT